MSRFSKTIWLGVLGVSLLPLAGCNRRGEFSPVDMWNRSRIKPLEASTMYADGRSSRPIPPGTVWHGQTDQDKMYPPSENGMTAQQMRDAGHVRSTPDSVNNHGVTGDYRVRGGGAEMTKFPFPVTKEVVERGKERYDIYCSPCHGLGGDGDGMIVRRGFSQPPTYHQKRLREAPVGHYFDVITNGYGAMFSYASRISPEDRWAIVSYIRALQLARTAKLSSLSPAEKAEIAKIKPKATPKPEGEEEGEGGEH